MILIFFLFGGGGVKYDSGDLFSSLQTSGISCVLICSFKPFRYFYDLDFLFFFWGGGLIYASICTSPPP